MGNKKLLGTETDTELINLCLRTKADLPFCSLKLL